MPKVRKVIESEARRGNGKADDPIRCVLQYHTLDGKLLACGRDEYMQAAVHDLTGDILKALDQAKFADGYVDVAKTKARELQNLCKTYI